ncbi:MAG: AAA family ATPase [Candidatus Anstonellales archaeon]
MTEIIKRFVLNTLAETPKIIAEELKNVKSKRCFVNELRAAVARSGQRVFILTGLRGTGKTTGLYQLFNETAGEKAYFSCDELISRGITLNHALEALDYIKKERVGLGKKFLLLLDEITYLPEWDIHLKVLHDRRPNLVIIATSSSALPLRKTTELTRRAYELQVHPLSFREYLMLRYGIVIPDEISKSIRKNLGKKNLDEEYLRVLSLLGPYNLLALYDEYMRHDLPAALRLDEHAYADGINKIVKRTIYEDFSRYEKFETRMLTAAERLIKYLSTIPADAVKLTTLSEVVGVSKESIGKLLEVFENGMIIKGIEYQGRGRMFKKPKKWFFYSPSMRYILALPIVSSAEITGNLREDSVFRHLLSLSGAIFYSHEVDFIANGLRIEVGGKGKKSREGILTLSMDETISKERIPIPLFALSV